MFCGTSHLFVNELWSLKVIRMPPASAEKEVTGQRVLNSWSSPSERSVSQSGSQSEQVISYSEQVVSHSEQIVSQSVSYSEQV